MGKRRDLRGVPDNRLLSWQHSLDQMDAVRQQGLAGTSRFRPSTWGRRRQVERVSDIAYFSMYDSMRNPNLSEDQFKAHASSVVNEARGLLHPK